MTHEYETICELVWLVSRISAILGPDSDAEGHHNDGTFDCTSNDDDANLQFVTHIEDTHGDHFLAVIQGMADEHGFPVSFEDTVH
jgi:hypothetical protein